MFLLHFQFGDFQLKLGYLRLFVRKFLSKLFHLFVHLFVLASRELQLLFELLNLHLQILLRLVELLPLRQDVLVQLLDQFLLHRHFRLAFLQLFLQFLYLLHVLLAFSRLGPYFVQKHLDLLGHLVQSFFSVDGEIAFPEYCAQVVQKVLKTLVMVLQLLLVVLVCLLFLPTAGHIQTLFELLCERVEIVRDFQLEREIHGVEYFAQEMKSIFHLH